LIDFAGRYSFCGEKKLPRFKDREEYERWKKAKMENNPERSGLPETDYLEDKENQTASPNGPEKIRPAPKEEGLRSIEALFACSWEIFKHRFGTLISLYLLSGLVLIVVLGIFIGTGYVFSLLFPDNKIALIAVGTLIGMIPACLSMFWCMTALTCAVTDESLGIRDALVKGWEKVFSFMWLVSLLGFLVTGGFLLMFIPGIIFLVWFSFSQFILVSEDERGMNALLKSKEYVRDRWFDIFLRLFVIWLVSAGIGMIPLAGAIVSIFFVPYMMIFTYLIYQDVKTLKGEALIYPHSSGEKFKWIGAGTLGYIVFPIVVIAIFIGIFGASLLTILALLKGMLYR
jgi:hypothetical protein